MVLSSALSSGQGLHHLFSERCKSSFKAKEGKQGEDMNLDNKQVVSR